ncbi:MAG: response regulator, partial [Kiloniellales bacterium]|nr:response regulator [Kiloniellales bacterium]
MQDEAPHILVVDDDDRLRNLLRRYLTEQGFRVTTAGDVAQARDKLRSLAFDLLVLDIMMPGESGLDLTRSLRRESDVPILLLTAMGETADRIDGLECGADDYLTKPFEPRELVLRIKAVLRRMPQEGEEVGKEVHFGVFCFDLEREELRRGEAFVRLTAAEVGLLKALARRPGVPVSREDLTGADVGPNNTRAVDVQ